MRMHPSTRAVGYVRVSTEDQQLGPEVQRAALLAYAAQHGVEIVAWHEEHVSGGAPLAERVELLAAVQSLATHKAGVLLVHKRDRMARDVMLAAMIEASVKRNGGRVVSLAGEGTADDDPSSVLLRRMVDAFAEYERLIIGARVKAALAVKRARGEMTGACRYGWQLSADGVHVERSPAETEVIARARTMRARGDSVRTIRTLLGPVSRTGKLLTVACVHALVSGE